MPDFNARTDSVNVEQIMDQIREKTADIPGVLVEVTAPRAGPPTGKPVQVQIASMNPDLLPAASKKVAEVMGRHPDIRDLDDGLPLPGIDWKVTVDKAEAAKYGAGINTVGTALSLVTNGTKITEYRPSESDKPVDIIVRFPEDKRSLDQIDDLRVQINGASVPIGNFVTRTASRMGPRRVGPTIAAVLVPTPAMTPGPVTSSM